MKEQLRNDILQVIVTECNLRVTPSLSMPLADLDIESVDIICTISALEERFSIDIPFDSTTNNLETVGDITTLVENLVSKGDQV